MGLTAQNITSDPDHYEHFLCGECGDLAPYTTAVETPCCGMVYCETCLESYAAKMSKTCGADRSDAEKGSFWNRMTGKKPEERIGPVPCPHEDCDEDIDVQEVVHDYNLKDNTLAYRIFGCIHVRCVHSRKMANPVSGREEVVQCRWTGSYAELTDHIRSMKCEFICGEADNKRFAVEEGKVEDEKDAEEAGCKGFSSKSFNKNRDSHRDGAKNNDHISHTPGFSGSDQESDEEEYSSEEEEEEEEEDSEEYSEEDSEEEESSEEEEPFGVSYVERGGMKGKGKSSEEEKKAFFERRGRMKGKGKAPGDSSCSSPDGHFFRPPPRGSASASTTAATSSPQTPTEPASAQKPTPPKQQQQAQPPKQQPSQPAKPAAPPVPPAPSPHALLTASHLKDQGNEEYKRENWKEAMSFYNRALSAAADILAKGVAPKDDNNNSSTEQKPNQPKKEYMTQNESDTLSKVFSNRAACWLALGQHQKAVQDCQEAIKLDPNFANAHKRLAQAYQESGDFDAAVLVLSRQLTVEQQNDKTSGRNANKTPDGKSGGLASMFTSQKEKDARLTKLGSKVPMFKDRLNFVKRLQQKLSTGKELVGKGDAKAGVAQFREALEIAKKDAQSGSQSGNTTLQVWLARGLFATGNLHGSDDAHQEVRRITQELLRDKRDHVDGYIVRGLALFAGDDLDKALAIIKEALKLSPDCKEAMTLFKKVVKPICAAVQTARKAVEDRKWVEAETAFGEAIDQLDQDSLEEAFNLQNPSLTANDKTMYTATIIGLTKSSLKAILYGERSLVHLRIRSFNECISDADACLRLLRAHKSCRSAVKNKANALLDSKKFQKCVDWLNGATASEVLTDDDESEADSMKSRCESALKKGKRPDYYKILSKSPSVKELIHLKQGQVWRTCLQKDDDSSDEEEDEDVKRKRRAGYVTQYSQGAQIKTAYRRRCLELHPDKQATRLSGHNLSERENTAYTKNVDEHFKLVQEAYDILSDESKKRFYDQGLDKEAIEERVQQNQRFGGGGGFSHFGGGFGGGGFGFR